MSKLLGYVFTPFYYLVFGLILGIFHPVQVIAWHLWGYEAQKRSVDFMNYLLLKSQKILAASHTFAGFDQLPAGRPLIIVANHQSMFDISPVVWGFRKHYPKFISKIELAKGIPSISYNLRRGGSAIIDRQNKGQAIREIIKLGQVIEEHNYSACIFPEGTRSKNGSVKNFKIGGIDALVKTAPSALIVPFVIDGNNRLLKFGYFPLQFGVSIKFTVLDPIEPRGLATEDLVNQTETAIKKALNQA